MFKKIELWILFLVALILLVFSFFFGVLVRQELEGSTKLGIISKSALEISRVPARLKWIFSYKNTNPQFLEESNEKKIVLSENKLDSDDLYLLSRYSNKYRQGIVELRTLKDLKLLHTYIPNQENFFLELKDKDNFDVIKNNSLDTRFQIDSPILNSDGSITAVSANSLFTIDLCNNLKILNLDKHSHQSLNIDASGNFVFPLKIKGRIDYSNYIDINNEQFENNGIGIFSQDGKMLFSKSIIEILIDNGHIGFLFGIDRKLYDDPIHLNDVEPAKFDSDYFKKDDLFLSLRHRSAIIHYRPKTNKVIEIIMGPFSHQHDVDILDNKTLLFFNNNTINYLVDDSIPYGEKVVGYNEILKYDLENKKFSNFINPIMKDKNVKTPTQGLIEVKENYVLVEEHDNGVIHLFSPKNEVFWQFKNVDQNKKFRVNWGRIESDYSKISEVIKVIGINKC
ncbi:arylsulfotransferase family protein [Candidatus Pelagibacter sp.]|nr:arylsulfotransferase family protein [Candidatus Pelagibacter sp.]